MGKKALLEAILFLSSKALTERQLAEATDTDLTTTKRLLSTLAREYEERDTALEVTRRGRRWALQVRPAYLEETAHLAPTTMPRGVLKTAGLIAYHQPVKQSHLASLVGSQVYDHVRRLREKGLIAAKPHGRTLLLSTTSKFPAFFGLDAHDRDDLRRLLEARVAADDEAAVGQT